MERRNFLKAALATSAASLPDPFASTGGAAGPVPDWSQRVLRSLRAQPTLTKPERWNEFAYPFVYGAHDAQQFPTEDFRECCLRSLAQSR